MPAPILFGVFSRNRFKVIRNYTQVLNLTCYHGFQPNLFGLHYVDYLFLYFLSTAGQYILSQNRRQYGDALDKFEPNDLNAALCPDLPWFSKIPRTDVDSALACVRMTGALSEKMQSVFSTLLEPRVQANPQYKSKVLHTRLPVEHNYAHVGVHA